MSDILIKNMEMPKNYPYRLTIEADGTVIEHCFGYRATAIELPHHGRLIDADKSLPQSGYDPKIFMPKYGGDHRTQYDTLMGYEIFGIVENAPTVLEASE